MWREDSSTPSLSEGEKEEKKREAGNAATKDNNYPAGGQRELLRRTMLSPPGAECRATKLCPVLHEDRLVLHEIPLFIRPRAAELPPPASCTVPSPGPVSPMSDAG